jgi:preprotein translocase subunit SecD
MACRSGDPGGHAVLRFKDFHVNRTNMIASLTSILLLVALAVGSFAAGARPQLGLDLQGGISAALRPDPDAPNQPDDMDAALDLAVELIRQRVDGLGVAEPDIARSGDDTILVQLPGITDADRAREVIGQTAQLGFYPVVRIVPPGAPEYFATPPCLIPDVDRFDEVVTRADGSIVYVLNPERPNPADPFVDPETEQETRYVCDRFDEERLDEDPSEPGPTTPRLEDLMREQDGDSTEDPTEAPTTDPTEDPTTEPTDEPTGDAMAAYRGAQTDDTTEAPEPTESATDEPTEQATEPEGEEFVEDPLDALDDDADPALIEAWTNLPDDAPLPLKYVVGPPPTDTDPMFPEELRDAFGDTSDGEFGQGDPLTGEDIVSANPTIGAGGWVVQLDLDQDGGEAFRRVTSRLACLRDAGQPGQLAIVLDDVVQSATNMAQGVNCGTGIAGGSSTITMGEQDPDRAQAAAQNLALVLEVGALPVTLTEVTFDTVSPTLGAAALQRGLGAGGLGLLLVGIYLFWFYRGLGLVALGGLAIFGALMMGTITLMGQAGFALTLAGIAGIIVAIGITADSSIIFLERIRDEVALGKTMRTAVSRAYKSAFRTNLAGNTITLAAAVILYFLAIGPVRGFAFTLGVATILDIFILWAYSRAVIGLMAGSGKLTREVRADT